MSILFGTFFFALSVWILVALFRQLRNQRVGKHLWFAYVSLIVCGVTAGIWCALYCEYHIGTRLRISSFPIPIALFHLEDGQWIDFPVPQVQAWSAIIANILTITALVSSPLRLILKHYHKYDAVI